MKDDLQLSYENVNTLKPGKFQSESGYPKSKPKTWPHRTQFYRNQAVCWNLVNKLQRVHILCLRSAEVLSGFPSNVSQKE
jgi:hypothetical protein